MANPTNPNRVLRVKDLARFKSQADTLYSVVNRAFPSGWRTSGTMAQLIADINGDSSAKRGMSYLSTVSITDLPAGMVQAEMLAEIMDELAGDKTVLFTVTSSNTSPYHWEYTSAYGASGTWRSFGGGSADYATTSEATSAAGELT